MAHAPDPLAFPAVASTALATSSREAGRPLCRPAGRSAQQPAARGAKGNRPGWDERGSGTVYALGVIAIVLIIEMKSLLIGEGATVEEEVALREALESDGVDRVIHMKTQYLGPDELLVAAKIALPSDQALADAAAAAAQGVAATADSTASRGRASYLGDAVIGVPDPGALVMSWLFEAAAAGR